MGLRVIALLDALVVIGLGAWCKALRRLEFCNVLTV